MSEELNDRRPDPHEFRNKPKPFEKLVHNSDGSDISPIDRMMVEALSIACQSMDIGTINEVVCTAAIEAFISTLREEYNKNGRMGRLPFMFLSKVCDCDSPDCPGIMTVLAFAGAEGRKYANKLSEATQELLKSTGGSFE